MGYRGTNDSPTVFKPEDNYSLRDVPTESWAPFLPACKIMVSTLTAEPVTSTAPRASLKAGAAEFQLLGLRPREARLDVIRRALTETAGDVKASEHWAAEDCSTSKPLQHEDGRLAQVAVAGYHLLDPRRRRTLFERVQLLLWTEEDLELPTTHTWDFAPADERSGGKPASAKASATQAAPTRLPAKPIAAQPTATQPTVTQPVANQPAATEPISPIAAGNASTQQAEETQAALEVFRSLRSRDRRATALWASVVALAISLPGAVALVLALI